MKMILPIGYILGTAKAHESAMQHEISKASISDRSSLFIDSSFSEKGLTRPGTLAQSCVNKIPQSILTRYQDLRHILTRLHTNPSLIPLDAYRFVIARKPVTSKPQLES